MSRPIRNSSTILKKIAEYAADDKIDPGKTLGIDCQHDNHAQREEQRNHDSGLNDLCLGHQSFFPESKPESCQRPVAGGKGYKLAANENPKQSGVDPGQRRTRLKVAGERPVEGDNGCRQTGRRKENHPKRLLLQICRQLIVPQMLTRIVEKNTRVA